MKKLICLLLVLGSYAATAQKWIPNQWADFKFPEIEFINEAPDTEGWKIYNSLVPDPVAMIQQHAYEVARTLYFTAADTMAQVDKVTYRIRNYDGISSKGGRPPHITIQYSTQWVEKSQANLGPDQVLWETRGVLYHELVHGYQLEPKGAGRYQRGDEYFAFIEGVADAVRAHHGYFPIDSRKPGGHWMDGYRTTGFFIQWLTQVDPDFIRKFNRTAVEINPWSFDAAFKSILGEKSGVDEMWQQYQNFLVLEQYRKDSQPKEAK